MERFSFYTQLFLFVGVICYSSIPSVQENNTQSKRIEKQEKEIKQREECTLLIYQRTDAGVAEDWENLERLANDYLTKCRGIGTSEDLSESYLDIAVANNNMGRPRSALAASESCIRTYYGNPGCHIEKAVALMKLGRTREALKVLDISEKLANLAMERNERDLRKPNSPSEKELLEARKFNLEYRLNLVRRLRKELLEH